MSTPTCPMCGAASTKFGFECGSGLIDNYMFQSDRCATEQAVRPIRAERDQLAARVKELEAWKQSAMEVEREWDANAIALMLGGRFGESQRAVIQREVPRLIERVKRLEEAVEILVAFGNQLGDELDPPNRNCSCHILPPCQDCEQWDSQRVAKSDWANAVERATKAKETKP